MIFNLIVERGSAATASSPFSQSESLRLPPLIAEDEPVGEGFSLRLTCGGWRIENMRYRNAFVRDG
jgi:hypothetical protein